MSKSKKEKVEKNETQEEGPFHASLTLYHNVDFIEVKSPSGKKMLISIDKISAVAPPWNDKGNNYESPYGKTGGYERPTVPVNEKSIIFLSSNNVIRSSDTVDEIQLKINQKLGDI